MKPKAKVVQTPFGSMPFPLSPRFLDALSKCQTNEDLFSIVEENGFINPDAFAELSARHLVNDYEKWKEKKCVAHGGERK